MMFDDGFGDGYSWGLGDGYICGYGHGDFGDGDGYFSGRGFGDGDGCGDGLGDTYMEDEAVQELSAIRLLADDYDINFYVAQLHLMVQRTTTLKEETK